MARMKVADQVVTDRYAIYCGDSCEVLPELPDESVDLVVYSPPFAGLWVYSSSERDLSNCRSYEEFFKHYEFIVRETHRLLKSGRMSAVHCMDIPKDGANICGYTDFPGDIIKLHERAGFDYTPRICIWKEPLAVRNRTMSKALAHRQIVEDSTLVNVAAADYLIPFRKKGKNKVPVKHPDGFMEYAGERRVPDKFAAYRGHKGDQKQNRYSHWIWRQYASSVWDDIRGNTGGKNAAGDKFVPHGHNWNGVLSYKAARDAEDEKHLHPLQLDVISRACVLWTNPGEVVLTPFMGVGSEVYAAVLNGRRGIGVELKGSYFRQAKKNLREVKSVQRNNQGGFFDAE